MAELQRHVREELAEYRGMIAIDPGGSSEKGTLSRGVARQRCGRPGKQGN
jgi:SRSO17 transposase